MGNSLEPIADALLAALGRYDDVAVGELLAPDAVHWLNLTGNEQSGAAMQAIIAMERAHVAEAAFTERGRMLGEDGFTLQLTVDGTTTSGTSYHVPVCLVVTVADGRITRIDEYANFPDVAPLLADLGVHL